MKTLFLLPFWVIIGAGLAYLFLVSQRWSVFAIKPTKPRTSKWLIIGGAIIRWVLIGLIFIVAASYSFTALFTIFLSFIISRLLILYIWQKSFDVDKGHIH